MTSMDTKVGVTKTDSFWNCCKEETASNLKNPGQVFDTIKNYAEDAYADANLDEFVSEKQKKCAHEEHPKRTHPNVNFMCLGSDEIEDRYGD